MQTRHIALALLFIGVLGATWGAASIEPGFGGILGGLMTFVVGIFLAMSD